MTRGRFASQLVRQRVGMRDLSAIARRARRVWRGQQSLERTVARFARLSQLRERGELAVAQELPARAQESEPLLLQLRGLVRQPLAVAQQLLLDPLQLRELRLFGQLQRR